MIDIYFFKIYHITINFKNGKKKKINTFIFPHLDFEYY